MADDFIKNKAAMRQHEEHLRWLKKLSEEIGVATTEMLAHITQSQKVAELHKEIGDKINEMINSLNKKEWSAREDSVGYDLYFARDCLKKMMDVYKKHPGSEVIWKMIVDLSSHIRDAVDTEQEEIDGYKKWMRDKHNVVL
jgi:hypothetical protein